MLRLLSLFLLAGLLAASAGAQRPAATLPITFLSVREGAGPELYTLDLRGEVQPLTAARH